MTMHVVVVRSSPEGELTVRTRSQVRRDDYTRSNDEAIIGISIRHAELASKMTLAIANALSAVATPPHLPQKAIRLRGSRTELEHLEPAVLLGALVNLHVPHRNPSRLPDLVDALRNAGVLGIQLVWDGENPARDRVEQHVFEALERGRAKPTAAPVVLAKTDEPSLHLRFLVASQTPSQMKDREVITLTKGPVPC